MTVGSLSSAKCRPVFMQFTDCDQPVQRSYSPEMQLTGWDNADMRNVTCADTQTSIEWPYCPFPILVGLATLIKNQT